ncbi:MAG: NADH-quinone oxidoreductase subunit J, partial [Pseudoxanthomonas sp.]|nr:NADH-quinone oxidoreductase subunit J [Pseudoxanthomonas sp.]
VLIGIKAKSAIPYAENAASIAADASNTTWIARTLFTEFLLPFEFAAIILTVAVVVAVMLTLRRRQGTKHQDPAEQSRVKAADRLRMMKVAVEHPVRETLVVPAPTDGPEAKP